MNSALIKNLPRSIQTKLFVEILNNLFSILHFIHILQGSHYSGISRLSAKYRSSTIERRVSRIAAWQSFELVGSCISLVPFGRNYLMQQEVCYEFRSK